MTLIEQGDRPSNERATVSSPTVITTAFSIMNTATLQSSLRGLAIDTLRPISPTASTTFSELSFAWDVVTSLAIAVRESADWVKVGKRLMSGAIVTATVIGMAFVFCMWASYTFGRYCGEFAPQAIAAYKVVVASLEEPLQELDYAATRILTPAKVVDQNIHFAAAFIQVSTANHPVTLEVPDSLRWNGSKKGRRSHR